MHEGNVDEGWIGQQEAASSAANGCTVNAMNGNAVMLRPISSKELVSSRSEPTWCFLPKDVFVFQFPFCFFSFFLLLLWDSGLLALRNKILNRAIWQYRQSESAAVADWRHT